MARLRGWEVEQARRDLARALTDEHNAAAQLEAARAAPAREAAGLAGAVPGDPRMAAFGVWLQAALRAIATAQQRLRTAAAETAAAAALLADRLAALKAAEALLAERHAAEQRRCAKRAQSRLDDVAARRIPERPG